MVHAESTASPSPPGTVPRMLTVNIRPGQLGQLSLAAVASRPDAGDEEAP